MKLHKIYREQKFFLGYRIKTLTPGLYLRLDVSRSEQVVWLKYDGSLLEDFSETEILESLYKEQNEISSAM